MKKRILSSCVLALSLGTSINAWSELPEYNAIKSIQTFDVGQDPSTSDVMIINHNKDKHVLLVRKDHTAFAVADLSIDISEEEAISHLKNQYLTGNNEGFLDRYPTPPENLSSYTELGFDDTSTQADFEILAQRIIVEAKGYLSINNFIVPWQEGYAAYSLADGYISVDDIDDSYLDGFYRCSLSDWSDATSVGEHCNKTPGLDFHKLTTSSSKYIGMTASDKAFIQSNGYLWNLDNGHYVQKLDHFSYTHQPITISHETNQSSSPQTIKFYQDDTLDAIEHEGIFVPTMELGFTPTLLSVFEDNRAMFVVDDGADGIANSCKLEFGAFDFTPKELDLTINGMVQELLSQHPAYVVLLGNYPNKPDDIDAANEIIGEGPDTEAPVVITESMTDEEFKTALDDLFLTAQHADWVENAESNYLAQLAEFSQKYPDQYYHCVGEIKHEELSLVVAKLGSFINSNGYLFGSSGQADSGLLALSTFAYTTDGGYQLISDEVFKLLTNTIPAVEIDKVIADIISEYPDRYGSFPDAPANLSSDAKIFHFGEMNMLILKKLKYNGELGLASVSSDNSGVLLGQAGSNGSWLSGRGSSRSYLIYNQQPKNVVRIIPNRLTIDPYDQLPLNTKIEMEVEDLYGVELKCDFDSNALSHKGSHYGDLFPPLPLSYQFPISLLNENWSAGALLLGQPVGITKTGIFAEIDYDVAYTTAEIELSCTATLSDLEGNALPVIVESAIIKIDDGIHGLAGESGEIKGTINIPVSAGGQEVTVIISIDGRSLSSTSIDGTFSFEQLKDGVFTMTVKSDNHVAACTTVEIIDGNVVVIEEFKLIAGDVTGDGVIDVGDISVVSASNGLSSNDEGYDEKLDLNRDGLINIQDISIIGSHFNSRSCIQ